MRLFSCCSICDQELGSWEIVAERGGVEETLNEIIDCSPGLMLKAQGVDDYNEESLETLFFVPQCADCESSLIWLLENSFGKQRIPVRESLGEILHVADELAEISEAASLVSLPLSKLNSWPTRVRLNQYRTEIQHKIDFLRQNRIENVQRLLQRAEELKSLSRVVELVCDASGCPPWGDESVDEEDCETCGIGVLRWRVRASAKAQWLLPEEVDFALDLEERVLQIQKKAEGLGLSIEAPPLEGLEDWIEHHQAKVLLDPVPLPHKEVPSSEEEAESSSPEFPTESSWSVEDVWIKGEFLGEYRGRPTQAIRASRSEGRVYGLELLNGTFRDTKLAYGPPPGSEMVEAFSSEFLNCVWVDSGRLDEAGGTLWFETPMHEVHVIRPSFETAVDVGHSTFGRVRGFAFARVKQSMSAASHKADVP